MFAIEEFIVTCPYPKSSIVPIDSNGVLFHVRAIRRIQILLYFAYAIFLTDYY